MSCPFIIQPHQIQGLDYPRLFPVIQWLVKIVLNFQQETAEFTRKQAAIQFEKISKLPEITKIRDLNNLFLPKRKFKTTSNRKLNDPIRIYAALLEFGDATAGNSYQQYVNMNKENTAKESQGKDKDKDNPLKNLGTPVEKSSGILERKNERISVSLEKFSEKLPESTTERIIERFSEKPKDKANDKKNPNEEEQEEEEEVNLLEQDTERVELRKSATVLGKNVAKIVKSENISVARNQYLDIKKEENPEILQKKLEKEREERLILTLTKEIDLNTETLFKLQAQANEIKIEVMTASASLEEEKDLNNRLKESITNLEENTRESKANLQIAVATKLEQLVIKRNQLKESQKIFKEKCNKEIEEMNKRNDQEFDTELQE